MRSIIVTRTWRALLLVAMLFAGSADGGVPSYAADAHPECSAAILHALSANARKCGSLYVEYDTYVVEADGTSDRKLSVIEAIDSDHHFMRVVHWYHKGVYDLGGREEFDPLLNWYLWTTKARLQLWETERRGVILDATPQSTGEPLIKWYSSFLGRMPTEEAHARAPVEDPLIPYSSTEYYLPWSVEKPGWRVLEKEERTGEVCLTRSTAHVTDALTVDLKMNSAIVQRHVRFRGSSRYITIRGADFVEAAKGLWLPRTLRINGHYTHTTELRASVLKVNTLPSAVFEKSFPPGTLVHDKGSKRVFVVPGGEDLLDFTVERMRWTIDSVKRRAEASTKAWVGVMSVVLATAVSGVIIVWWVWAKRCKADPVSHSAA